MTRQKISFSDFILFFLLSLSFVVSSLSDEIFPKIESYARVSTNRDRTKVAIDRTSTNRDIAIESRNFQDTASSRSPVYVSAIKTKLRNGEAIDHRTIDKYTTLDREAIAKLDNIDSLKRAQDRFHPPASFEHTLAHSNVMRQKSESSIMKNSDSSKPKFSVPSYATLPKDVYRSSYDYQTDTKQTANEHPAAGGNDYSPDTGDSFSKIPDSYAQPEIYGSDNTEDNQKFSGFPSISSYENNYPTKPVDFSDNYDRPSYVETPYISHHNYNHDIIYDHPPDEHFYEHSPKITTTTTTEEPEMNDERLSKRPYSYYYIGKKLWYIPLYFSIYFIIYIAALVLKSITRHKINFPASLAAVAADARNSDEPHDGPGWYDLTKRVLDGIDLYNSIGKSKYS